MSKRCSLPSWARAAVFSCMEHDGGKHTFGKLKNMLLRQKNTALSLTILSFAIHQTTANDKSELLQRLLDIERFKHEREKVVNMAYGKYLPIHRAAYNLSDKVFAHLLVAGAKPVKSPQGETLEDILSAGLEQAKIDVGFTLGKIKHYSPKTNFYSVELPNGDVKEYSSALVVTKKYTKQGHLYVPTPTKGNLIFVEDRYRRCLQFLERRKKHLATKRTANKRPRLLTRHRAALRIQCFWRNSKGGKKEEDENNKNNEKKMTFESFHNGGLVPPFDAKGAVTFVQQLIEKGKRDDFTRFKDSQHCHVYQEFVKQNEELVELAREECPILLS
jgi:hypothetical protein